MHPVLDSAMFCLNGNLDEDRYNLVAARGVIWTLIEVSVRRYVGVADAMLLPRS